MEMLETKKRKLNVMLKLFRNINGSYCLLENYQQNRSPVEQVKLGEQSCM